MEITKQIILEELNNLIGTEVSLWSPSEPYVVIRTILSQNNYPIEYLSWSRTRQTLSFTWRGYQICWVDFKKAQKGKKEHYWQTQKYAYKEFSISFPWEVKTLNESISKAEKCYEEACILKNEKLKRDTEAFKLLKEHFKLERDWDVRDLIDSIDRNYYNITKLLESEN